jgi:hypothetical protein
LAPSGLAGVLRGGYDSCAGGAWAQGNWRPSAGLRSATSIGIVARCGRGAGLLRRNGIRTTFPSTPQPGDWYAGGDLPDNRYGNLRWSKALRDRNA